MFMVKMAPLSLYEPRRLCKDLKEFIHRMQRLRGWLPGQSEHQWNKYKADVSVDRDEDGIEEGYRLQLDIPIGKYTHAGGRTEEENSVVLHGRKDKSAGSATREPTASHAAAVPTSNRAGKRRRDEEGVGATDECAAIEPARLH